MSAPSYLNEAYAPVFAELLLRLGAVKIDLRNPFTWTSGRKAPIYCDNRQLLGHPTERQSIKEHLLAAIRHTPKLGHIKGIAAVATAGIPFGTLLADNLELPFAYVRTKPKAHGLGQQIEGCLPAGASVLLFEDLISTGGSVLAANKALIAAGHSVAAVVALFCYGMPRQEDLFKKEGLSFYVLSDYKTLLAVAQKSGLLSAKEADELTHFFDHE